MEMELQQAKLFSDVLETVQKHFVPYWRCGEAVGLINVDVITVLSDMHLRRNLFFADRQK
jgi:hypothetical protein